MMSPSVVGKRALLKALGNRATAQATLIAPAAIMINGTERKGIESPAEL